MPLAHRTNRPHQETTSQPQAKSISLRRSWHRLINSEKGVSLIEVLLALVILSTIGVSFLGGLTGTSKGLIITDERDIAKTLAQSQMEYAMKQEYALSYSPAPIPDVHSNYSAVIATNLFPDRDHNIQKITVTIHHQSKEVTTLEGYKINR